MDEGVDKAKLNAAELSEKMKSKTSTIDTSELRNSMSEKTSKFSEGFKQKWKDIDTNEMKSDAANIKSKMANKFKSFMNKNKD